MKNLQDFNIRLEQIIAITTDSGKNMLKSIACLNAELQNTQTFAGDTDADDEFIDHDIFDDKYYNDPLKAVQSMFKEINHTNLIHGIPCAAHCLHLVVTKAMQKSPDTLKLIEKCRDLAKKLRCPTFREMLRSAGECVAILDVKTRWNSIYSMLNRLVSLQSFCDSVLVKSHKQIRGFLLSESEWDEVNKLVHILKPFDKYTKALQSELENHTDEQEMVEVEVEVDNMDNISEYDSLDDMNLY
ncbi:uncharacterized protein LOC129572800 [Sitodiplosis mosellana]|uniref:uncharacterized protein LOC129572800 n=1 Tax=Sitodiplosis mosellana TaxID=263140 RepID=UPI002443C237|nr:uncharacterized protein LOC129572800 [Sitodiplosis mosellana]